MTSVTAPAMYGWQQPLPRSHSQLAMVLWLLCSDLLLIDAGVSSESGVPDQPFGEDDTKRG
jgi:hypothetical protein